MDPNDRIDIQRFDTHTLVFINGKMTAKRIEATGFIEMHLSPSQAPQAEPIQNRIKAALMSVPVNRTPNRHERRRLAAQRKSR
jgi:hypothetical protein